MIAAYGASKLVRLSAKASFCKNGRAMLSSDVITEIGSTFQKLWPSIM